MADTNVDKYGCIDVCQHIITATKQLNVHTAILFVQCGT